ncbi:MAG: pyridoxal-phosphate dependent enzyme, partial [Granulosicoccus sp.]|nr:pyridoxal-phosphate dependent enzyme [Granulosicoccus sp.]
MIDDKKIRCLRQALAAWPKAELGHFPTPLEPLQRLHGSHNENRLWIKRDDCSGLGLGGNKVRQLEYYMGDAMARQSDCVLSTGAVQSNYMRTLAAAAAKLGLECHIQLESRVSDPDEDYLKSGNVLLDKMFGATIHHYAEGEDESGADAAIEALAAKLQESGKKPYIVP